MSLSVSIDRASLSLPPLVLGSYPSAATALWLPEDGVGAVDMGLRRTYAPDSKHVGGRHLLAAVREASTLPLTVYARGATDVALASARIALDMALGQWDYYLLLSVDGVTVTYRCEPEVPRWGAPVAHMARAHMDRAVAQIPINP